MRTLVLLVLFGLALPSQAFARRHLVAIASHRGGAAEQPLRYAGRDAERIKRVFHDLGEVAAADALLLVDPSAREVRETLEALRGRVQQGDALLLYLSTHMDDRSVHLGPERLDFEEIFAASRATGASLRVFILDGCRSGSVTRKGMRRTGPARILRPRPRPAEGEVVLTSTSPHEDALESERLGGSFFTHYLVTGLRGAADADGNGKVSIEEVQRFAHDSTVYATAGSPTGSQHPSFKLDLAGTAATVLTEPGSSSGRGARLRISSAREGVAYLLHDQNQQLVAEISLAQPGVLVVPTGTYRLRVATAQRVEEGRVALAAPKTTDLSEVELSPVSLLTLVRKGEGERTSRPTLRLELTGGLPEVAGFDPGLGVLAGGSLEWRSVSLFVEAFYGYSSAGNQNLDFSLHRIGLAVGITHPLQLGPLTLSFGLALEGILALEKIDPRLSGMDTLGDRQAFLVSIAPLVRVEFPVGSRWVPAVSVRGRVVFSESFEPRFAPSAGLSLAWVF